ncbi:putative membrane protein [Mucilaginibacter sp. UYNi724]
MSNRFTKWLRGTYNKIVTSIAFYPALIAIGFLVLSWLMLELDFSETGKHIKSNYSWIRLKDASTARSIVSTIAGGIISLMVFSFSMVMILLN